MDAERQRSGAKKAVLAALLGNFGVGLAKLVAYLMTGSAAMLAETFHSLADTVNQIFLLLGLRLGRRAPDERHPFGYGRESYFWAFIVALSIFLVGALYSFVEGLHKVQHPEPMTNPAWNYAALAIAAAFEGFALSVAWREFKHWRALNPGALVESLKESKSPTILVVLFEDSAALLGILVATTGITLALVTKNPFWDGLASMIIGVILFCAALFIGWRTRGLLIGEGATKADRARIRKAVESVPQVASIVEVLTLHLGPHDILVNLNVNFVDDLDTDDLEQAVDEIETRIRQAVPTARRIFIEAESLQPSRTRSRPA